MGRAMAELFAAEGADVVVTFHSDEQGGRATARAVENLGRGVLLRQLDVRDEESVEALFDAVDRELGTPDVLVNNAGVGQSGSEVAETELDDFDRVVRTDLHGPFLCCRAFARRREAQGDGGRILNVTSVHEAIPSPGAAAYGAAKGGLLTLTRSLALELAPLRINVNAVAPGLIRTPMTQAHTDYPATREKEMPNIPWRRPGEPWEVARLALYLVSDAADYVTGQSFTIDGGLTMNWGQGA